MSTPIQIEMWRYFKPDERDPNRAICNLCNKIYARHGRTTSSLLTHLKTMHPEFRSYEKLHKTTQVHHISYGPNNISTPVGGIVKEEKWDTDCYDSIKIDKLIGEMIALQNVPFNFVLGIGFRRLIEELAPRYKLRGRKFFTGFVCNELYGKVTEKVRESINQLDYMSFTSEVWSDASSNVSLFKLTCHGITENFDRSSIVLKCDIFHDHDVGDIVAEKFDAILYEWNIQRTQVHCLTRDESSSMKRAMRLAAFNDVDCIVHKMRLAIRSALQSQENIDQVKQKCMKISTYFKNSTTAQKELQTIQDRLGQPHLTVYPSCVTQWNTFCTFDRVLKLKDALSLYTSCTEIDKILPEEWKIIASCIELLKPFEEAARELSSTQALISSVIPIIQILGRKLDDYLARPHELDPIRLAVMNLKSELSAKFSNLLEENNLYVIATYLDPRYKHKFFTPVIEERIKEDILQLTNSEDDISGSLHDKGAKRKKMTDSSERDPRQAGPSGSIKMSCIRTDLALMMDSSSDGECEESLENCSTATLLKKELLSYRKKKRANVSENPLKWWGVHKDELKLLAPIARRYLSPPPTSVPTDQPLSSEGLMYEPLQNRLESEKAAILLFIKYNAPIFNFSY